MQKTEGGCWLWTGARSGSGRGNFMPDGRRSGKRRMVYAHRFAYELLVGPVPEGLELDHLCRIPLCVNPEHLEAVTHQENVHRGIAPSAVNARKTHCRRGHPLSGMNLYIEPGTGGRRCVICRNLGNRRRYHLHRGQAWLDPAEVPCNGVDFG